MCQRPNKKRFDDYSNKYVLSHIFEEEEEQEEEWAMTVMRTVTATDGRQNDTNKLLNMNNNKLLSYIIIKAYAC